MRHETTVFAGIPGSRVAEPTISHVLIQALAIDDAITSRGDAVHTVATSTRRTGAGLAPWQARRVVTHVDENLAKSITIDHLAGMVGLSGSYFCRAFKDSFGHPPHAYIMRRRVERAQALMLRTREPLSQIALACGLSDQAHLCNLFRRLVGVSPSHWRRAQWRGA